MVALTNVLPSSSPPIRKPESDVDMPLSGTSTPPSSATRPLHHKGPPSNASSRGGSLPRHQHHHLCQHHENNRHRPHTNDLPTAFHSLLGTALFLFGNIIGANPELALEGEPTTSTVYHLYALDVFEVGESLPSKTLVGRHDGSPTSSNPSYGSSGYGSGSDVALPSAAAPTTPQCCAQGMKEDWQMAVTWGRALVSLAEDLLERQKIVEARQQAIISHASGNPGAAYQRHQPFENPAAFLSEDFCIPTFMHGGGYFTGTGGQGMGLTLNGAGSFVPIGTGVGGSLSAFHSPALIGSNPGSADDYWTSGATAVAKSEATFTPGSTTSHISTYASSSSSGSSSTTISSLVNTPIASAAPRLPTFPDRQPLPQGMYPSSSFLSPSFIAAASTQEGFGTQLPLHTPLATPTGNTPGAYSDPRRLWSEDCPFVVIRSRMPPVTRRMSLGVGAGTSVDEMMTLAVDQFSRGIFHMPKAASEGGEDVVSPGLHGVGGHRKHHHHHRHSPKDEHPTVTPGGSLVPASFSRASHLYTIAVQVLLLAEKMSEPESRYKWGRYADSVFGQMKLEESPIVEVVSAQSESLTGALNYGAEERMDVDEGSKEEGSSSSHHPHHRHRHAHHHKHTHGHHRLGKEASEGSGTVARSTTTHPYLFLNNNSNPDILKARGRCALIIGGARAEASVEEPLEEVLNSAGGDEKAVEKVKQILQGEDAEEARERLEEAVKLLERARDVWRKDVWDPRKKVRESVRRRRGRTREAEKEKERLRLEKEAKEREEKERQQRERTDEAQADMQKKREGKQAAKSKESKLGKVKRRGIGKVAADNKRASKPKPTPASPPSSSSSNTPTSKGKERAVLAPFFPTPSELGTPQEEKVAEMRVLQSPGTEYPPVSPEPSGSSGGSETSRSQAVVSAVASAMTDYFPPIAPSAPGSVDDEEEEEKMFRAQEEEEQMEEVDLAQLLAEALVTLAELQLGKEEKERFYRRAKEEAKRAGKEELVEEELEGAMNVD